MSKSKKQYTRNVNYISEENNGIELDSDKYQEVFEEPE